MQNTALLKEIGQTNHPVLLKRGMCSPLKDFFWAAEYIAAAGNNKIIMCERGIRTFEYSTRNTLDISAIAIIKQETSLPVIVDLSHSLGRKDILEPVSKAVLAAGADGIMVEVHNNPPDALCDAEQQLSIEEFNCFYDRVVG
jgi:3-deoxy-7-phosphoheptulonate synthase